MCHDDAKDKNEDKNRDGNQGEPALRETRLSGETVFRGRLLDVRRDTVRLPDGRSTEREYIRHPGAVLIIAQLDNGRLLFERQFRYPLDRVFLELPAGKIDAGENILTTAQRELREETGYTARDWHHLGTLHPCIGYSDERIEIFLARQLAAVGQELDDNEFLEVIELDLEAALEAVRRGELSDAKTISGLLWAERILSGRWPLPARADTGAD